MFCDIYPWVKVVAETGAMRIGYEMILAAAVFLTAGRLYAEEASQPVQPDKSGEALELPALPEVPGDAMTDARDALDKSLEKKAPANETQRKRAAKRGLNQRNTEREKQNENKPETNKRNENTNKAK